MKNSEEFSLSRFLKDVKPRVADGCAERLKTWTFPSHTIIRIMVRVGQGCERIMDEEMRDLTCKHIQLDEIWCFVGKKQRHVMESDDSSEVGDFWTWVANDSDTKLILAYKVGKRDAVTAQTFIEDLQPRLANWVQLSSDGLQVYVEAVERSFVAEVDYAQVVKFYEAEPIGPGRYSPPKVVGVEKSYVTAGQTSNSPPPLLWKGRISRCAWECADSLGLRTRSARRSRI